MSTILASGRAVCHQSAEILILLARLLESLRNLRGQFAEKRLHFLVGQQLLGVIGAAGHGLGHAGRAEIEQAFFGGRLLDLRVDWRGDAQRRIRHTGQQSHDQQFHRTDAKHDEMSPASEFFRERFGGEPAKPSEEKWPRQHTTAAETCVDYLIRMW